MKSLHRHQKQQHQSNSYLLFIILIQSILLQCKPTHASITMIGISSNNGGHRSYRTFVEKKFGNKLALGVEYIARLQFLGEYNNDIQKQTLVSEVESGYPVSERTLVETKNDNRDQQSHLYEYGLGDLYDDAYLCNLKNITSLNSKLIVPQDGLPVALLTPKGKCSTKTKAKVASALLPKGTVHHLIVYGYDIDDGSSNNNDDDDDDGFPSNFAHKSLSTHLLKSNQISLIDEDDDNDDQSSNEDINVSIVYISAVDGIELISTLNKQPEFIRYRGGPQLLIDSYEGWNPYYNDDVELADILSAIALIILCCMTLSCVFSSSNMVSAGVVLVDEDNEDLLPGRYRHGLRLLNRDEVLSLPEVEFTLERALINDENNGDVCHKLVDDTCCSNEKSESNSSDSISESNSTATPVASPTTPLSPTSDSNEAFHDITCTICLEDYVEGEKLRVLPCHHAFHSDCIIPWLTERSPTCPLCKALMEVEREEDEIHRRQREERRRQNEREQDSSDEDDDHDEDDLIHQMISSWQSFYHSTLRRQTTTQSETDQSQEQISSTSTLQQDSNDIEMANTEENQPSRSSSIMEAVSSSWRRRVILLRSNHGESSDSNNDIIHDENQSRLEEMQQPLLLASESDVS